MYLLICGIDFVPSSAISEQKLSTKKWHPTRVPAGVTFVGDQVCAECHKNITDSQSQSSMAMAMESVKGSKVLTEHSKMTFRAGNYSYEISRKGDQSFYTVTDGKETISLPILYAFGQGKAGQTYLLEYDGAFYEGHVSFYQEIKGLDFTIGQPRLAPVSLREALGRRLSRTETLNCFNCHATGAVSGGQLHLDKLTIGIRCEACHGPGGEHVAAVKAQQPNAKLIFNPAQLSGDELTQDFCASCHRGNEEGALLKSMEVNNVRFQPYRMFHSKCYSDDQRISCTACHNPHEPLNVDAAYYDAKCLNCHLSSGKVASGKVASGKVARGKAAQAAAGDKPSEKACRVAVKNCASCHMPKVEPPGAHFKFTDHYIRMVKTNETYKN